MADTADRDGRREIDLLESLNGEWLKLPFAVMRDRGPAVQTLGGLLSLTKGETFSSAARIADKARLPVQTARKHLASLASGGWLENLGRERTRAGFPRRTVTLRITKRTKDSLAEFGVLPWWATGPMLGQHSLKWSEKAVLAVVMAELMKIKAAVQSQDCGACTWAAVHHLAIDCHFRFSLRDLTRKTGLHRESAVEGKWGLRELRAIRVEGAQTAFGDLDIDRLLPNDEFRVIVTPSDNDFVFLDFRG